MCDINYSTSDIPQYYYFDISVHIFFQSYIHQYFQGNLYTNRHFLHKLHIHLAFHSSGGRKWGTHDNQISRRKTKQSLKKDFVHLHIPSTNLRKTYSSLKELQNVSKYYNIHLKCNYQFDTYSIRAEGQRHIH